MPAFLGANPKTNIAAILSMAIPLINQVLPILPPPWAAIATGLVAAFGLFSAKDA